MESSQEESLFRGGIAALQGGNAHEARANFQTAIDANIATARTWLGMALACLSQSDIPRAEAALDQVLKTEPHNLRALIMKGDILVGRNENQAASAHYALVLRLSASLTDMPAPLQADINRIAGQQQYLMTLFKEHLYEQLATVGYRRAEASQRFTQSLDMLLGRLDRTDPGQQFPQAPHVYFLPNVAYHTFFPEQELPWLKELEAHTDVIESELQTLLSNEKDKFSPYIHGGIDRPQNSETTLLDSRDWTSAYLWEDGSPNHDNMALCPKTTELLSELPLTLMEGFSPSVLFSKLDAGARIEPHTGMLNTRLICHLPLVVPDHCALRVGDQTRSTQRGVAWAFDDSVNHEAWNLSNSDRVILLFDVWRPDINADEQHLIKALLEGVAGFR
ncbi:aspartyl/asparaginyl beta-hydroxylase domain-containing protein [bacterium]|nr:aspartyl/asparaginyl beta-hydroxylase domain-containing protein [bacterium]